MPCVDFRRRGGLVISDQYLRAEIPAVIKFNFDFTYRNNISANAILENVDHEVMSDHIKDREKKLREIKGVTALDDQRIMESYAAHLKASIGSRINKEIDCDNATVLLNVLENNGVKYLFVINDKRCYDQRLGRFKAILEKAVPQTVGVSLNQWPHEKLFLYDLLEKKEILYTKDSGIYKFDVELSGIGGKIVVMLNEKLNNIEILAPNKVTRRGNPYRIDILIKDDKDKLLTGVQPVKVNIIDPQGNLSEYNDYYAAQSGRLSLYFTAGINDIAGDWTIEAEELIRGKTQKFRFRLEGL